VADFRIEGQVGYWLLQLGRVYRTRLQAELKRIGLYSGQDLLLLQIMDYDGQTQSELADRLNIQAATLTRMVDRMIKAGLVRRTIDPMDKRITRIYLTKKGSQLRKPLERIWSQVENSCFESLSLEEHILLRRLLMQIHQTLDLEQY
jgi:DNA-binding MarR family transcriptional regulator